MNVVVAMKQIPDLQQIRIKNRQPVFDDVPLTFGSIDKNALEAGVNLKENGLADKVIVLSAGNEDLEDTIKEALAAGADEAFLILGDDLNGAESSVIAQVLTAGIKQIEDVGLILFGEGSGDNYSGQVGSRVAEILGWPQVGYAGAVKVEGNKAVVTRVLEDAEEVVEVSLPAVITVVSGINEARIPSVTQILKAGKKPKEIVEEDELDEINKDALITTVSNLAPESDRKRVVVKSTAELVDKLKSENMI
ncbi:electron transfer flavoprotein subunit beta/FixA family protein [Thermosyntropha sp.]|uniref:electron transfer flavoprotein subunit beta/FixA family protein n=1 Tax=Thermosyntropha sp. TaxID=2740820 RepID=UPI0025F25C03|nr:electron transfer flavoprotein subunit beta/FixA family protein [Thermosyntropha sp.]MBO8158115.1 electron transfer flavoprotein subunit beta/FixA family protein [Thermosyntropha sp.]